MQYFGNRYPLINILLKTLPIQRKIHTFAIRKTGVLQLRAEIIPLEPEQIMLLRKLIYMTFPCFFSNRTNKIEKTKTMKKLLLLLLLSGYLGYGQQVNLTGTVTDENNETLVGATVFVKEIKKGIATNFSGDYFLTVPKGKYTVLVAYTGYKSETKVINIQGDITQNFTLKPDSNQLEQVVISAVRAGKNTPIAQTNISQKTLQEKNLGQDVPFLLDQTPSVVTTSDAGAGVGYTGIRIRGISSQQINVTLNGVPLNDPESHGVYWVDIPDFAASTSSLQVQRGVGTSTFGTGAFGASISLETDKIAPDAYAQIASTYGSFNTQKYSIKTSTGLINNHFEFTGRFSKISSEYFRILYALW